MFFVLQLVKIFVLKGKRNNFYGLVQFFENEIKKDGVDSVVGYWFPKLTFGIAQAALHGTQKSLKS